MVGVKSSISAIAVHPHKPLLAIAGSEGFVLIYDYMQKGDPKMFQFEQFTNAKKSEQPPAAEKDGKGKKGDEPGARKDQKKEVRKVFTCIEFTPQGDELLVAKANGVIEIIDPETGKYKNLQQTLKVSDTKSPYIKQMIVSRDGKYFACADVANGVSLFKKERYLDDGTEDPEAEWQFCGKHFTHQIAITSICFGEELDENDQMLHRLFSVGADRRCFEYNIPEADIQKGLPLIHGYFDIELEAKPTACIWYP